MEMGRLGGMGKREKKGKGRRDFGEVVGEGDRGENEVEDRESSCKDRKRVNKRIKRIVFRRGRRRMSNGAMIATVTRHV